MYPLLQNPERYTWDFWYVHDAASGLFHLLYLNAPSGDEKTGQHHFVARVGYAVTRDFVTIEWLDDDAFSADIDGWDNTSIWSGDVVKTGDGEYTMFYTSRDGGDGDGRTQNIGAAVTRDFRTWSRVPGFRLAPDGRWYDTHSKSTDTIIHAWRDPFLYREDGAAHMLLSAKDITLPEGKQGAIAHLTSDTSLFDWAAQPPLYASGDDMESELSQLYLDKEGQKILVYSVPEIEPGRPGVIRGGRMFAVNLATGEKTTLVSDEEGLYACRVIPELGGDIVGFDMGAGGLRRIGLATGLRAVGRDFSNFAARSAAVM